MKENEIEKRICFYAKQRGWLTWKLRCPNVRGVPDRIFLRKNFVIFIEFKTPKNKLSDQQGLRINELRKHGFSVYVIDNISDGEKIIDANMHWGLPPDNNKNGIG